MFRRQALPDEKYAIFLPSSTGNVKNSLTRSKIYIYNRRKGTRDVPHQMPHNARNPGSELVREIKPYRTPYMLMICFSYTLRIFQRHICVYTHWDLKRQKLFDQCNFDTLSFSSLLSSPDTGANNQTHWQTDAQHALLRWIFSACYIIDQFKDSV